MESLAAQLTAELSRHADERGHVAVRRLRQKMIEAVEAALCRDHAAGQTEDILGRPHLVAAGGDQQPVALARHGPRVRDRATGAHWQGTVAGVPPLDSDVARQFVFAVPEREGAVQEGRREEGESCSMSADVRPAPHLSLSIPSLHPPSEGRCVRGFPSVKPTTRIRSVLSMTPSVVVGFGVLMALTACTDRPATSSCAWTWVTNGRST